MRIVLNFVGLSTGGGRTDAINLLATMPAQGPNDQFLAVVPSGSGYEKVTLSENCVIRQVRRRRFNNVFRVFFDNFLLPKICRDFSADVLFTMCNNGPVRAPCRHVVMLRRPQFAYSQVELSAAKIEMSATLKILRWLYQVSIKSADALIFQTATMRDRVTNVYSFSAPSFLVGKTVSAPIATSTDDEYNSQQIAKVECARAGLSFLYLTKYYPHKNIEGACEAVAEARDRGLDVSLTVTLSSSEGPECASLIDRINAGEFGDAVINVGTVDLANIASLYRQADAVLAPTLLESYSATFLEAMRYRKPILTSDRDFSREICGDAALYFEPLSVEEMVGAIRQLHDDPALRQRLALVGENRLENSDKGWTEIAGEYLQILRAATG